MVQLRVFFPHDTQTEQEKTLRVDRFEIFKGKVGQDGKIRRVRTIGWARLSEGYSTYIVQLKSLQGLTFYMLPERSSNAAQGSFSLLTREDSNTATRRYFWNKVGEGVGLSQPNHKLIQLRWDIFAAEDIYLNLEPMQKPEGGSLNAEPAAVA